MPRNVKLFLLLSAGLVLWQLEWHFSPAFWPSPTTKAVFAKYPDLRQDMEQGEILWAVYRSTLFVLPIAILAAVAGFGGRNWARWGLAAFLIVLELLPWGYDVYSYYYTPEYFHVIYKSWADVWHEYWHIWTHWRPWVVEGTKFAMIVLIFSPNARPWFRKEPAT